MSRGTGLIVYHDVQALARSRGEQCDDAEGKTGHDVPLSHSHYYIDVIHQPCVLGRTSRTQPRFPVSPCPMSMLKLT